MSNNEKKGLKTIAPYIPSLQKEIDIFSGNTEKKVTKFADVYEIKKTGLSGNHYSILSSLPLTKDERRNNSYILSRWMRHNKVSNGGKLTLTDTQVTMNITDILEDMGLSDSSYNRKKLQHSLDILRTVVIAGTNGSYTFDFNIYSGKGIDTVYDTLTVELSPSFIQMFLEKKVRYQFIGVHSKAKGKYAIPTYELLQAKGGGAGRLVKHLGAKDLSHYLGLSGTNKDNLKVMKRALNELRELGEANYTYNIRFKRFDNEDYKKTQVTKAKEDEHKLSEKLQEDCKDSSNTFVSLHIEEPCSESIEEDETPTYKYTKGNIPQGLDISGNEF